MSISGQIARQHEHPGRRCQVIETALIVLNFEALSGSDLACAGYPELKSMRAVSITMSGFRK
jgi:hypothetical protein